METKRQLAVLDRRLGKSKYLAGDDYTISDRRGLCRRMAADTSARARVR
jgi:glutathione S-transferase